MTSARAMKAATRCIAALVALWAPRLWSRPAGAASAPASRPTKLAYEVLVPPGAGEAKLPVVLYLHPAFQPHIERARADYWPVLRERNCLMVIPRSRGERMWLAGEDDKLLDVLEEVRLRRPADEKRIILLGVSGGGQMALRLADQWPERFRAVVVVNTSPVVVRGETIEWFYPARDGLKTCPYLVVNHITQGSSLMYWRQVQARLEGAGASISVLPVTAPAAAPGPAGQPDDYLPPPKELSAWLADVLAGKRPAPLPDPQKQAVARMFAPAVAALPEHIEKAPAVASGKMTAAEDGPFRLTVIAPAGFERSPGADRTDSAGEPMTQLRLEHEKWPITVRVEARATEKPMPEVLAAEEQVNRERGLLYQVFKTGNVSAGRRAWQYRLGSMTYPDRRRGWVSVLFVHAAAPMESDPARWLTVLVADETQQPDAKELAEVLKGVLGSVSAVPTSPAPPSRPAATAPGP